MKLFSRVIRDPPSSLIYSNLKGWYPIRKQYIEVPVSKPRCFVDKLWIPIKGIALSPVYFVLAFILGTPGITIHVRCMVTGIYLWCLRRISLGMLFNYLFFPIDSTRYFEFHEVWKRSTRKTFNHLLDVSSPRLFPLLLLKNTALATAVLLNPDSKDLCETQQLAGALGVNTRCKFINSVIDHTVGIPASFDLITCLSVLEHIPDDKAAVETIWSLLRPGGRLILTLPCMSQPLEQFISHNPYGVLSPGDEGYTFWQRYYDNERLASIIFPITGKPTYIAIYGEIMHGSFFRNACMKRLLGSSYPFWREPYMMASEYKSFVDIDDLPGEGVVVLEFIKH